MNIIQIAIDKLIPNDWNPNHIKPDHYAKLKRNIQSHGEVIPIVVRVHPDKKGYHQIIDGYHRWQIYKELGKETVDCVLVEVTDDQAKILTINLNYLRGQAKKREYAELIHSLSELHSLEDLELILPDSKPQLLDDLELLQLPSEFSREIKEKTEEQAKETLTSISFQVTEDQRLAIEAALEKVDRKKKGTALCELIEAGASAISGPSAR